MNKQIDDWETQHVSTGTFYFVGKAERQTKYQDIAIKEDVKYTQNIARHITVNKYLQNELL